MFVILSLSLSGSIATETSCNTRFTDHQDPWCQPGNEFPSTVQPLPTKLTIFYTCCYTTWTGSSINMTGMGVQYVRSYTVNWT